MDRKIVFPGAIPLETDLLGTNKNAMIALAKLAEILFGTGTIVSGLGVSPTSPASLSVSVAPGQIYALENMDSTDYSSIVADIDHQIVKQGIMLDAATVACAAPGTVGYSINYLIQATFQEVDQDPVLLPYYNSSNPAQPYAGPNNTGLTNNTNRACKCVVAAKAGTASTTGTQTTPSPDVGYVGIGVVTVAHGQTTILSGDISSYKDYPALPRAGIAWDAKNKIYTKDISGSGNFTLTDAEASNPIIQLDGALTGNVSIVLPNESCQWVFINNTTGAYTVYLTTVPAGTDCSVDQSKAGLAVCDGAGTVRVVAGGGGGGSYVVKTTFTATAGQTSFSHTYAVGSIFMVTRNGVSVGYTATSGTAVVLSTPASLSDEVVLFEGALTVPAQPVATEVTQGIARVATDAEMDAESSDSLIITPLKLYHANIRVIQGQDQKSAGTDGGTFTSGAWQTRTLTQQFSFIPGASITGNQITLPSGVYWIDASAPAYAVNGHQLKLYNVTDSVDEIFGLSSHTGANGFNDRAVIHASLVVSGGPKVYELRHKCQSTVTGNGFGKAANVSGIEVFAEINIRKL